MSTVVDDETSFDDSFLRCGAFSNFSLNFETQPFEVNLATTNMHEMSPRFGHSNDINDLILGSRSEQQDYLTGLLSASFAVFCLFLLWMCILLIFQCLGPSKVGFLSGRRNNVPKPEKPPAVKRQERRRRVFQHNGVAGDVPKPKKSSTAKVILKPVKGVAKVVKPVAKAPIKVVSQARKKKREIERRNQFNKMTSAGSYNEEDLEELTESPNSPSGRQKPTSSRSLGSGSMSHDVVAEDGISNGPTNHDSMPRGSDEADRKAIAKYEQDWKAYENAVHRSQDRMRRIRVAAGFCSVGIFVSSIFFTVMCQQDFTTSIDNFKMGLSQINAVVVVTFSMIQAYTERRTIVQESTSKFILQVNGT